MFDINRELELVGFSNEPGYTIQDLTLEGQTLRGTIYCNGQPYDKVKFDAKTGVFIGHYDRDTSVCRLREKSRVEVRDRFYVTTGRRDWAKGEWAVVPDLVFDTGKEAQAYIKTLNSQAEGSPWRYAVRKEIEQSAILEYDKWAAERFETGEWTKLPWANKPWADRYPHHHAHHSLRDRAQVAFWNSPIDGQSERIQVMTAGRYLNSFFSDVLSPNEIRDWAVLCDPPGELEFHSTPEAIVAAYVEAETGCMRYPDGERCHDGVMWRSGRNPTFVYGAGDLAVAILRRHGRAAARALTWPAKKVYGRIYGDIERMKSAFEQAGYQADASDHGASTYGSGLFNGARLLKVEPETQPGNFIVPYIDYFYNVEVEDDYLVMCHHTRGEIPRRTDGLLRRPRQNTYECCDCEEEVDEDSRWLDRNSNTYCETCYYDRYSTCYNCSEEIDTIHDSYTHFADNIWCRSCADEYLTSCDYCGDIDRTSDLNSVHDARDTGLVTSHACDECANNSDGLVRMGGLLVDADTTNCCDECGEYRSANLDECPECQVEETV